MDATTRNNNKKGKIPYTLGLCIWDFRFSDDFAPDVLIGAPGVLEGCFQLRHGIATLEH
jgi:hypothetical protein